MSFLFHSWGECGACWVLGKPCCGFGAGPGVWVGGPGHAASTSVYARLGHPGPRTVPARPTTHPARKRAAGFRSLSILLGVAGPGCCACVRDRVRHGCRTRAYRDVFTACPAHMHNTPGPLPTPKQTNYPLRSANHAAISRQLCDGAFEPLTIPTCPPSTSSKVLSVLLTCSSNAAEQSRLTIMSWRPTTDRKSTRLN